jgi:hypothetical protein
MLRAAYVCEVDLARLHVSLATGSYDMLSSYVPRGLIGPELFTITLSRIARTAPLI